MILAGDIGGTKTILALYDAIPEARASLREAAFPNAATSKSPASPGTANERPDEARRRPPAARACPAMGRPCSIRGDTGSWMIAFGRAICGDLDVAERREWLVTNSLGGYASGTVAGLVTRRYHGLLVAALTPPLGRTLMVAKLDEIAE